MERPGDGSPVQAVRRRETRSDGGGEARGRAGRRGGRVEEKVERCAAWGMDGINGIPPGPQSAATIDGSGFGGDGGYGGRVRRERGEKKQPDLAETICFMRFLTTSLLSSFWSHLFSLHRGSAVIGWGKFFLVEMIFNFFGSF